jgi:hypothetical protein
VARERHGDVAIDAVEMQPRMIVEARIIAGVADEQRRDRAFDDASIGRTEFELVAWLEAKARVIQHGASSP